MRIDIVEESAAVLAVYGEIPIAFRVESRFRVENGPGGVQLVEEPVEPYVKDYDAVQHERPAEWHTVWPIENWGVLSAFEGERRVGGAAVAWRTEGLPILEGRDDAAALWDLRVHPDYRGQGVGRRLFTHSVRWARDRGCRRLVVETQNVNVPACRFYERQGCVLDAVNREAHGEASDEIQLLWRLDL